MVSGQGGETFLEKISREAPKFVFSLPTLHLITLVGKDPLSVDKMKAN